MFTLFKNNKGIILITSYAIAMVLLIVTGAIISRVIVQTRAVQRERDTLDALYAAEIGVEYAFIESYAYGWNWCTHDVDVNDIDGDDDTTELMSRPSAYGIRPTTFLTDGSWYDYGDTNAYTACYLLNTPYGVVRVKAYPEMEEITPGVWAPTGAVIILSQGTAGGSTKTIEYYLSRRSLYDFFYFYPYSTTFGGSIYNGRGYGGIHVNGEIRLSGNNYFYYLTELSCSGYIKRPWSQFADSSWYSSEQGLWSSFISPAGLRWDVYSNINHRFNRGTTYFRTGPEDSYTQTQLPWYLEGEEASWEFDKYRGTDPGHSVHFNISDTNLKHMAIYEMWRYKGSESLFNNSETITVTYKDETPTGPNLPEEEAFKTAYINELNGKDVNWDNFWMAWRNNHNGDYSSYSGLSGQDWERKYWMARYNWTNPDSIHGVNREWWEDLSYTDDRGSLIDDMADAEYVDWYTENSFAPKRYLLDTEEQATAWEDWIKNTDDGALDGIVQDQTLGGVELKPPEIEASYKDLAKRGGIYIGTDESGNPVNPLSELGIIEEKEFYNVSHPARDENNKYAPSKVLQIDVAKLKEKIEDGTISSYNGIIYVGLEDYWGGTNNAKKAYAVELHNAEALPNRGITLVTPNNVFIKGNYNLDPDGDEEKNRPADDSAVIDRVIASKDYITSKDNLKWQPSAVITNRLIHTLSEDYPEPSYMPLPYHHYYEYYDEEYYSGYDYVDHPIWGTAGANWMPDPADTGLYYWINEYFIYSGEPRPSEWTVDWIKSHWETFDWNDQGLFKYDTDGDGKYDKFISRRDLKVELYNKVYSKYNAEFSYDNIHPDGANPDTPSRTNNVSDKHIYNTAVVTPYSPNAYSLEYWYGGSRTINGAFLQLPSSYKKSIPGSSYVSWGRQNSPSSRYEYESRFGGGLSEKPSGDFFAGAYETSCWRIVDNSLF